ncbi:MAG: hypothetical protein GY804_12775 [Alphaproteobacteria bacterium]|nr:hypothetical protein [Alphaproteobacteria bacterium]
MEGDKEGKDMVVAHSEQDSGESVDDMTVNKADGKKGYLKSFMSLGAKMASGASMAFALVSYRAYFRALDIGEKLAAYGLDEKGLNAALKGEGSLGIEIGEVTDPVRTIQGVIEMSENIPLLKSYSADYRMYRNGAILSAIAAGVWLVGSVVGKYMDKKEQAKQAKQAKVVAVSLDDQKQH